MNVVAVDVVVDAVCVVVNVIAAVDTLRVVVNALDAGVVVNFCSYCR